MKKANKPVNDYVYDTMVGLTNQISLPLYIACATTVHSDSATESELRDAKMLIEFSWNEVDQKIDAVRKEFYNLLENRKWERAESLFLKYKLDLTEYMHNYLSQALVQEYVNIGLRDKVNRSLIYTPGSKAIVFGEKKEEIIIDKKITDSESLHSFWRKICDLCSFANMVAEQMKEDLNNKQFIETWNKYDEPTLIFGDLFITYAGMRSALRMLEDLNVMIWNGELPILSMQNIRIKGKDGKMGKGIKRFLGAWLYFCKYDMSYIKSSYNDTTIAMVALKYFGFPCENENAVREMIGDKAMESGYIEIFRNEFGNK